MIEPGDTAPDHDKPDGRVAHVIPKVAPKTHDEQALAALANLRDAA